MREICCTVKRASQFIRFYFCGLVAAFLCFPAQEGRGLSDAQWWRLTRSDQSTLELRLHLPPISIETIRSGDRVYDAISIDGFGHIDEPGMPQLPQKGWLVAIPPGAGVSIRVEDERSRLIQTGRVLPGPRWSSRLDDPVSAQPAGANGFDLEYRESGAIYQSDAFFPPAIASVGQRGQLRDQSFVQILLRPVQYNPLTNLLKYTYAMKVVVTFDSAPAAEPGRQSVSFQPRGESAAFEHILSGSLLNYDVGKQWRSPSHLKVREMNDVGELAQQGPAYKILVDRDGIYNLSYADLQAVGVPVESIDPRTFKLLNRGHDIAIRVTGQEDGRFDPADALIFYGQGLNTKFTSTNVYWLSSGSEPGPRMTETGGEPGGAPLQQVFKRTVHVEEDNLYNPRVPNREGVEHFYWNFWNAKVSSQKRRTYTASVRYLPPGSFTATLRLRLVGLTEPPVNPDHHLQIFINDEFLGDIFFDGPVEQLSEFNFPQEFLVEGPNVIRLEAVDDTGGTVDQGFVDWFEIDYSSRLVAQQNSLQFGGEGAGEREFFITGFTSGDVEVFETTDPTRVKRVMGFTVESQPDFAVRFESTLDAPKEYLVLSSENYLKPVSIIQDRPSSLRSGDNGADYILITHRDFLDEVQPLAQHRAAQGLRTLVVDVQDIYDEFSGGVFDPRAIRDFLAYAYSNWQTPMPSYALLVGDGNYDFKNKQGTEERNFIPPFLAPVGILVFSETATDNAFVSFSGDDNLPDMFIGRLPVNSPDQARVVVSKILEYENQVIEDGWNRRLSFVADDVPDPAGPFDLFSDIVADEHLPSSFQAEKIYLGITHATGRQTTTAIIKSFNEGRLIVNYVGHSAFNLWAGNPIILQTTDLQRLSNADRLPMVLGFTSLDAGFHWVGISAMGEDFLRAQGKGAIAWWGGTGGGLSSGHHIMNVAFFDALFRDQVREIGPATNLGKLALFNATSESDLRRNLIDVFVLLGDPAMELALPDQ